MARSCRRRASAEAAARSAGHASRTWRRTGAAAASTCPAMKAVRRAERWSEVSGHRVAPPPSSSLPRASRCVAAAATEVRSCATRGWLWRCTSVSRLSGVGAGAEAEAGAGAGAPAGVGTVGESPGVAPPNMLVRLPRSPSWACPAMAFWDCSSMGRSMPLREGGGGGVVTRPSAAGTEGTEVHAPDRRVEDLLGQVDNVWVGHRVSGGSSPSDATPTGARVQEGRHLRARRCRTETWRIRPKSCCSCW